MSAVFKPATTGVFQCGFSLVAGALLVIASLSAAGCSDEKVEPKQPDPDKAMLKKLDSEDPDKFLEGVDEAKKKYGSSDSKPSSEP
jgi:hypothetical protein